MKLGGVQLTKLIVVDVHNNQIRVAILEDGDLAEFYMEDDDNEVLVGNIYRGKIINVLPGMQAAFVDIGLNKNAFLYVGDINTDKSLFEFKNADNKIEHRLKTPSISDVIREGQEITVQVLKEPMGTKGARITTHITLPGRYLVLMPTVNYVGVSRRIDDEEERQRLREIAEKIKPDDMGIIVRTAAKGKDMQDFIHDAELLCRLWDSIKKKEQKGKVPRVLHKDESLVYRTVRDLFTQDIDKFIINDYNQYLRVLELMDVISPHLKSRVNYFDDDKDIFERYGINYKIEKAIQKKVWLKNGGYLVIDPTEALTVVDVNTGKFVGRKNLEDTVLKTNLEAAEEIAHQIRLRDIGGIIIIDFIDMQQEEHRQQVLEALKHALKKDRTKTNVVGLTGLGLIEMTRKKVRNRLSTAFLKPCPYCNGTGKVYSENMIVAKIEKNLEQFFKSYDAWGAVVEVHPAVARFWMDDNGNELDILESTLNKRIYISSNAKFHIEQMKIRPIGEPQDLEGILMEYTDAVCVDSIRSKDQTEVSHLIFLE